MAILGPAPHAHCAARSDARRTSNQRPHKAVTHTTAATEGNVNVKKRQYEHENENETETVIVRGKGINFFSK